MSQKQLLIKENCLEMFYVIILVLKITECTYENNNAFIFLVASNQIIKKLLTIQSLKQIFIYYKTLTDDHILSIAQPHAYTNQ